MSDLLTLELVLARLRAKYAEDQPRDDHGRFSDGGGAGPESGGSPGSSDRLVADDLGWDERIAWAQENFHSDEVEAKLTSTELADIAGYTSSGFEHINSALRGEGGTNTDTFGKPMDRYDDRAVAALDNAISLSTVPQDMTLFRGVGDAVKFEAGKTYTDPAFLSTSLSHTTAEGFADLDAVAYEDAQPGHLLELSVPKGQNGLYISDNLSGSDGEFEVVLPRNTPITVDSIDEASGTVKAHVGSA